MFLRSLPSIPIWPVGTAFGSAGAIVGALGMTGGAWQIKDALYDPWVTNRSYEEQFRENGHEWIHSFLVGR